MSNNTTIEWTDATWNPARGCSRVSQGCVNCYAERVAARFSGPGMPYAGLAKRTPSGPRWTGEVRLVEEHLLDPLKWTKPRRVFVNSMSDLFHEKLSDGEIDRVFAVMAACPQHTFQVLTKRPKRMLAWANARFRAGDICVHLNEMEDRREMNGGLCAQARARLDHWPLPNVWLGVSVEDQATADERIPLLLETPAAVRFISAEPLLGPVELGDYLEGAAVPAHGFSDNPPMVDTPHLDWVIVGGESGPGARPMRIWWARSIVEQCREAGVACFVKQLGSVPVMDSYKWDELSKVGPVALLTPPRRAGLDPALVQLSGQGKGGDWSLWPSYLDDLRVREFPEIK